MLSGWRAQQISRGLRECTIVPRERLVRRFLEFTNEYPWQWQPGHVDEADTVTLNDVRVDDAPEAREQGHDEHDA